MKLNFLSSEIGLSSVFVVFLLSDRQKHVMLIESPLDENKCIETIFVTKNSNPMKKMRKTFMCTPLGLVLPHDTEVRENEL